MAFSVLIRSDRYRLSFPFWNDLRNSRYLEVMNFGDCTSKRFIVKA